MENHIKLKVITSLMSNVHEKRFMEFTHDENIKIDNIESKVIYDNENCSKQYITYITYRTMG